MLCKVKIKKILRSIYISIKMKINILPTFGHKILFKNGSFPQNLSESQIIFKKNKTLMYC